MVNGQWGTDDAVDVLRYGIIKGGVTSIVKGSALFIMALLSKADITAALHRLGELALQNGYEVELSSASAKGRPF